MLHVCMLTVWICEQYSNRDAKDEMLLEIAYVCTGKKN